MQRFILCRRDYRVNSSHVFCLKPKRENARPFSSWCSPSSCILPPSSFVHSKLNWTQNIGFVVFVGLSILFASTQIILNFCYFYFSIFLGADFCCHYKSTTLINTLRLAKQKNDQINWLNVLYSLSFNVAALKVFFFKCAKFLCLTFEFFNWGVGSFYDTHLFKIFQFYTLKIFCVSLFCLLKRSFNHTEQQTNDVKIQGRQKICAFPHPIILFCSCLCYAVWCLSSHTLWAGLFL